MRRPARFGSWTTGIGLLAFSLICRAAPADTSVGFKMVAGRLVVVPVLVDNQGPFEFLLDTGTSTTIVDTELAQQLGLRTIGHVSLISAGGARVVPLAQLQSLTLGPKTVEGLEVLCADLGAIGRLAGSVRGVVGQQFLSQFNYVLSYQDRRLEFRDGDAADDSLRGVRLPFDSDEGRMVVAASAATASRNGGQRFVLDSGASVLVLFDQRSMEPVIDVEREERTAAFLTSQASLQLRTGRIRHLAVGGQAFHNLPVVLAPEGSGAEARAEDGLLPTNLFRAVYFNNREQFVLLNPRR